MRFGIRDLLFVSTLVTLYAALIGVALRRSGSFTLNEDATGWLGLFLIGSVLAYRNHRETAWGPLVQSVFMRGRRFYHMFFAALFTLMPLVMMTFHSASSFKGSVVVVVATAVLVHRWIERHHRIDFRERAVRIGSDMLAWSVADFSLAPDRQGLRLVAHFRGKDPWPRRTRWPLIPAAQAERVQELLDAKQAEV